MKSSYIWVLGVVLSLGLIAGCEDKNKQIATAPPETPPPAPEHPVYPPENPGTVQPPPPVTSNNPGNAGDTYNPPPENQTRHIPPTDKPKTTTARKSKPAPAEHYASDRPKAGQTYTVKKGDTLQEISQKYYGTTKKYQKIYQANKSKIKDPNKLTVGMKLTIPPK